MIDPDRQLWCSVLLMAVQDALHGPSGTGTTGASKRAEIMRARAYLLSPSRDLTTVCSLAGIEVEALQDRVRRLIAAQPPLEQLAPNCAPRPPRRRTPSPAPKPRTAPKPTAPCARPQATFDLDGQRVTVGDLMRLSGRGRTTIRHHLRLGRTPAEIAAMQPPAKIITLVLDDQPVTVADLMERTGLTRAAIGQRIKRGMSAAEIVSTPAGAGRNAPRPHTRKRHPGAPDDFGPDVGTGGGSAVEAGSETKFSEKAVA